MNSTILAAVITVCGTLLVGFLTWLGKNRTDRLAIGAQNSETERLKEKDRHDYLSEIVETLREQSDRAEARAETAIRQAEDALRATRECEQREQLLRREREHDRKLMDHMQIRLSRLEGNEDK